MKDFIYNRSSKTDTERRVQYIKDNEALLKLWFEDKYQFVCDYPFVLKFPTEEFIPDRVCKHCGQFIENGNKWYMWEDGFRPKFADLTIDLNKIAQILQEAKNPFKTLKDEYDEFVSDFKKVFSNKA